MSLIYSELIAPDYKELLGEFKPDERAIELHDRLQQYYNETPDSMSNKGASPKWQAFLMWCDMRGYTREEINNAKRQNYGT